MKNCVFSIDFRKTFQYQISQKKFFRWKPSCSLRTDGNDEAKSRSSQSRESVLKWHTRTSILQINQFIPCKRNK